MSLAQILKKLKSKGKKKNIEGMMRFGIRGKKIYGVPIPEVRKLAKEIGRDHAMGQKLWNSGVHEAMILAALVSEVGKVTQKQMDDWVKDFDSWDTCDQVCMNLFDKTPWAYEKALEWTKRTREFEKRAGFALMAALAFHDKDAPDKKFLQFFPAIRREATDERNFVKKAVNWSLRQIGKRSPGLMKQAEKEAKEIEKIDSKSARWIAGDALREFEKKRSKK